MGLAEDPRKVDLIVQGSAEALDGLYSPVLQVHVQPVMYLYP